MVQSLVSKQHSVFDENSTSSQNEGGKQVDVDVVSGTAELSGDTKQRDEEGHLTSFMLKMHWQLNQLACVRSNEL